MAVTVVAFASTQLSSCVGFLPPPIPVTLELRQGVEISAIAAASGEVDVPLGEVCGLFNEEELEALVRAAAGDLIADLTTITRIDLKSTDVSATAGNFNPFETAELDIDVDGSDDPLILGTAVDNDGLGTAFSLTLDDPVDLLNDLTEDQCATPVLHLDGAGFLEAEAINFDVTVKLVVYTEFRPL
jgi:hypothetical protein